MADSEIKELVTLVEDVLKRLKKIEGRRAMKELRKRRKATMDKIRARILANVDHLDHLEHLHPDAAHSLRLRLMQNFARMDE